MLNWNGYSYTVKSIQSLLGNTYKNFHILVLDNGSENKEAERIAKEFKKIKYRSSVLLHPITLFKEEKNLGYAAGMNRLLTFATGEYVCIVNNDMEFESDYIEELAKMLSHHKQIAVAQPTLKHLKNHKRFDYSIAAGGFVDLFGYPFARGRIFTHIENDRGQYDRPIKISWCGIFMAKKYVIKKIGLFDSLYENYGEDMDFCYRVYGAGYYIVNNPKAVGYHFSGGALKKNLYKKMFYHHRNNIVYLLKNFRVSLLLLIILPRIIFDFISIFYYLYYRSYSSVKAVFDAYISLIVLLPQILVARRKQQSFIDQRKARVMPMYRGCVVLEYFLFRKKRFSDIVKHVDYLA